ncbi:MAG: methionine adenosyltransferase [Candidatus Aenigmatarchaeota archaeon]
MNNVSIYNSHKTSIENRPVEIVERKGIGHPDTLADGIAESISKKLSKFYLENYGRILHHNTDQVEVVGGKVDVDFGEAKVIDPIHILLSGRATDEVSGEKIPVHRLAKEAAKNYLKNNLPNISLDENFTIDSKIGHGSVDLRNLYGEEKKIKANDTSFGVGYAPLSETEEIVLKTDDYINSGDFRGAFPELGQDVKIMANRVEDRVDVTVAGAFLARKTENLEQYRRTKERMKEELENYIQSRTDREASLFLNTADDYDNSVVYLTMTGTSAEAGDDGSVGRGNRAHGLIVPCRPMSLEAPAGKNPQAHVGKIYNLLAQETAQKIYERTGKEVYVKILSQIGKSIDEPQVVDVGLVNGKKIDQKKEIEDIVADKLENITELTDRILNDELYVY